MKILKAIFIMSILVGCGKSFTEPEQVNFTPNSIESVEINVKEENEVGVYSVHFLPKNQNKYSIIKHDFLNGEILELAIGISGEFIDEDVISGLIYKYEIGEFVEDKSFKKLFEKEIKIPTDLRLKSDEVKTLDPIEATLSESGFLTFQFNRLSLSENAKLVTNGGKTLLKVNKLFSLNGKVETFPPEAEATAGSDGKSGGELLIEVKQASGDLEVILRGENGGQGLRPSPLGEDGRGEVGEKGTPGEAIIKYYSKGSSGGNEEHCTKQATDGKKGKRGKKGRKANKGMRGGDSGIAQIYIEESDNFKINYKLIAGSGGNPSLGGEGGFGGHGGAGGGAWETWVDLDNNSPQRRYFNSDSMICWSKQGPEGDIGPSGETNVSGEPGILEKICIKKSNNEETKCFTNDIGEV